MAADARSLLGSTVSGTEATATRGPLFTSSARAAKSRSPASSAAPRALDRDRRLSPQARVPVLVPADPRGGRRLPPAPADHQEDAPPRAAGRRAALAGRPRRVVDQRRDAPRRTRARAPGPTRLRTHGQGLATEEGRERDTGPRISWLLEGAGRTADPKAQVCALTRRHRA